MNELSIIQRFCERRNIKYEIVENNNLLTEIVLDNMLRVSKMTDAQHTWGGMSYVMRYNTYLSILRNECKAVYIIRTLEKTTSEYNLEECCVCYELCRANIFKCIRCSAITCGMCSASDKSKKNEVMIKLMKDLNFSSDRIVSEIAKLKSACPVCRAEYDFTDLITERMNKN